MESWAIYLNPSAGLPAGLLLKTSTRHPQHIPPTLLPPRCNNCDVCATIALLASLTSFDGPPPVATRATGKAPPAGRRPPAAPCSDGFSPVHDQGRVRRQEEVLERPGEGMHHPRPS